MTQNPLKELYPIKKIIKRVKIRSKCKIKPTHINN